MTSRVGLCNLTSQEVKLYGIRNYPIKGTLITKRFEDNIKKEVLLNSLNSKINIQNKIKKKEKNLNKCEMNISC